MAYFVPSPFLTSVSFSSFFFVPGSLCKALHFLCNFFRRYCHLIQPASFTSLKNRTFQPPSPHVIMPSHSFIVTKTEHLCHLLFFIVVTAWSLQRVKLGQVVKGSSAFLFWSRLSSVGTVSLGCRCGKKIWS